MTTFSERLKEARKDKDLSQEDLARLVGSTAQSISLMERAQLGPSASRLLRLSRALDRDPFWLFPDWDAEQQSADSSGSREGKPSAGDPTQWVDAIFRAAGLSDKPEMAAAYAELDKIAKGDPEKISADAALLAARYVAETRARSRHQSSVSALDTTKRKRARGASGPKRTR